MLSERCQEAVCSHWAGPSEWPVSMPGSQRHSLRGHLLCVEKLRRVCGCILILHLCGCSRARPSRPAAPARLACINCPCLARCLLLITLINFNSPGSLHHHRGCLQTGTHTRTVHTGGNTYLYGHNQHFMSSVRYATFFKLISLSRYVPLILLTMILQLWFKIRGRQL